VRFHILFFEIDPERKFNENQFEDDDRKKSSLATNKNDSEESANVGKWLPRLFYLLLKVSHIALTWTLIEFGNQFLFKSKKLFKIIFVKFCGGLWIKIFKQVF